MKKPAGVMGILAELESGDAPETLGKEITVISADEKLPVESNYDPDHIYAVDTRHIRPWTYKDRKEEDINPDELTELCVQIHMHGQQQPVLLRPAVRDGQAVFEEIFGFKRVMACRELSIPVKAYIRDYNDSDAFRIQLTENMGRSEPSAWSRAQAFQKAKQANLFTSITDIATAAGLSRPSVANLIRIADGIPSSLRYHKFLFKMGIRALLELTDATENVTGLTKHLGQNIDTLNAHDNPAKLIKKTIKELSTAGSSKARKTVTPYTVSSIQDFFTVEEKGDSVVIKLDKGKGMIEGKELAQILQEGVTAFMCKRFTEKPAITTEPD